MIFITDTYNIDMILYKPRTKIKTEIFHTFHVLQSVLRSS